MDATPMSADNLCKQSGPRSRPSENWSLTGSKLLDTLKVFLKEFVKKYVFKKTANDDKSMKKVLSMQRVKNGNSFSYLVNISNKKYPTSATVNVSLKNFENKSIISVMVFHLISRYGNFIKCKIVIIFLPINLNMCFGYSKEPSH